MNKKIVNQIERVLEHCKNASEQHTRLEERGVGSSFTDDDLDVNKGWVEALEFVLKAIKEGSPVSDAPLSDNISICSNCDTKTDDDTETKWSEDADPYCQECYSDDFDDKHRTTVEVEAKIKGDE